jgi:hypothetical protein
MSNGRHQLKRIIEAFILVLLVWTQKISAQTNGTAEISGVVVDLDGKPLDGAVVGVLGLNFFKKVSTDSTGRFQIVVNREGWYTVYAMCDRSITSGVDYVPAEWSTYVQFGSTYSCVALYRW